MKKIVGWFLVMSPILAVVGSVCLTASIEGLLAFLGITAVAVFFVAAFVAGLHLIDG